MNVESGLGSVAPIETGIINEDIPINNLGESYQQLEDAIEADTQAALDTLKVETGATQNASAEVRIESVQLATEYKRQIEKAAAIALLKLEFIKEGGWLQAMPEPGEIETSLVGSMSKTGETTHDTMWGEEALATAKRGDPISVDEVAPPHGAIAKAEQSIEHFDALRQYENLRVKLQVVLKEFAVVGKWVDVYAPKTLQQALSEAAGASLKTRVFAGVLSGMLKDKFQGKVDGKSTDKAIALKDLQAIARSFFDNLESNFNMQDCFDTTNSALVSHRMAEMSSKKAAMGRTTPLDSLLMTVLMEVAKHKTVPKTLPAETSIKTPELPPEQPPKADVTEKSLGQITTLETTESGESWLDLERETAFLKVSDYFQKLKSEVGEQAVHEWFVALFNTAVQRSEPFTIADVSSLISADVISPSASRVAGREIRRPVLLFTDPKQFVKFVSFLGVAHAGESTLGIQIPGNASAPNSLFSKTGLIISIANKDLVGHEIRHSIDPFELKRKGVDRAIDEAFAYYYDEIENKLDVNNEAPDSVWGEFFEKLTDDTYEKQYAFDLTDATLPENWKSKVKQLVVAIKDITKEHGALYAQRLLVKSGSIDEILKFTKLIS